MVECLDGHQKNSEPMREKLYSLSKFFILADLQELQMTNVLYDEWSQIHGGS